MRPRDARAPTRACPPPAAVGLGLAEVVEERRTAARRARPRRRPFPGRRRTGARRAAPAAAPIRARSRSPARTRGSPRRARRCRARAGARAPAGVPSRSFESSPMPSASTPPPIRSAGDVAETRRLRAHLRERLVVERRSRAARRAAAPQDPERILAEALGPDGAQHAPLEVVAAAERVDELARLEPSRHRVDGEVTPRPCRPRSRRDGSATISKSRWPGPTLRSFRGGVSSIPAGTSLRISASRGWKRTPTSWPCTSMSSTRPCGCERRSEPRLVDAGDEEVLVRRARSRAARRARRRRRRTRRARASG